MRHTPILHSRGLTLIELMIALIISSVLMFGVATIYVSSKRGYSMQDSLARQQENSRFSLDVLMRDLRMAGYPKTSVKDPIITTNTNTADGGGVNNDMITVQFQSGTDCLGQPTPANSCVDDTTKQCAINKYYIAADPVTPASSDLWCLGNGGATPDVIAEGVTNLQIQYGVDTDTSGTANGYFTWNNISAADRLNIVSVRFALLSQTPNDVKKASTNNIYALLDQNIAVNDRKFHHVYSNTVLLRNRMQ